MDTKVTTKVDNLIRTLQQKYQKHLRPAKRADIPAVVVATPDPNKNIKRF